MEKSENGHRNSNAPASRRVTQVGALLLLLVSSPGFPQERPTPTVNESLSGEPPPGWKMSYSYSVSGLEIREFLPAGQTLEDWRDMITTLTTSGKEGGAPASLMRAIAESARGLCLEVVSSQIEEQLADGYPAATMAQFCLRDAQGRMGDVSLYRVIHGKDALHVLTRTRRGEPYDGRTIPLREEALARWRKDLDGFRICRPGAAAIGCAAY